MDLGRWLRLLAAPSALCLILLGVAACVELTGQRISWFYDAKADELRVLVFYDGIHESASGEKNGAQQIEAFVREGEIMPFDWPFYLKPAELRGREGLGELEARGAALLAGLQVHVIGRYREPDGRVGAVQHIVLQRASECLRLACDLVNRNLIKQEGKTIACPLTRARFLEAARAGLQWAAFEGHSIRVTLPIHGGAWARLKGIAVHRIITEIVAEIARPHAPETGAPADGGRGLALLVQGLASCPITYQEEEDRVLLRFGLPATPSLLRLPLRKRYEPSLEKAVAANVPIELDGLLSAAALGRTEPEGPLADLLAWGPPEERVRALLPGLRSEEAPRIRAVLAKFAEEWNRIVGVPEAPRGIQNEEYAAAWEGWYWAMRHFPLPEPEKK